MPDEPDNLTLRLFGELRQEIRNNPKDIDKLHQEVHGFRQEILEKVDEKFTRLSAIETQNVAILRLLERLRSDVTSIKRRVEAVEVR